VNPFKPRNEDTGHGSWKIFNHYIVFANQFKYASNARSISVRDFMASFDCM
jgi:hypothetical protein